MDILVKIKKYALDNHVPIARDEFVEFVCDFIKKNNYTSVLEIGTAIAYTAISLALLENVYVTTIEHDEKRFCEAEKNIKEAALEDKITLIFDDAQNVFLSLKYDLIFIDAAKMKNQLFFDKFSNNLSEGGTIIIDNMELFDFKKHVSKYRYKNFYDANEKLKKYLTSLDNYHVEFLNIGDGIALIHKK